MAIVSILLAILNGSAVIVLYRQYRDLAEVSLEFAALLTTMITEEEGEVRVESLALAGMVVDHLSRVSGMVRGFWR